MKKNHAISAPRRRDELNCVRVALYALACDRVTQCTCTFKGMSVGGHWSAWCPDVAMHHRRICAFLFLFQVFVKKSYVCSPYPLSWLYIFFALNVLSANRLGKPSSISYVLCLLAATLPIPAYLWSLVMISRHQSNTGCCHSSTA